jgi:glycosyltransferase involved in cell wall biosynthesis
METTLLGLAIFTLGAFILSCVVMWFGHRTIKSLDKVSLPPATMSPKVSILIPARNEEKNIAAALQSVLQQDYDNFEIIVVNDRSTDRTGEILDLIARANSSLHPIHVTALPKGWLGKNHALYCAAHESSGELLLFTDADIVMHPATF